VEYIATERANLSLPCFPNIVMKLGKSSSTEGKSSSTEKLINYIEPLLPTPQ
jgi:hypothetical protein